MVSQHRFGALVPRLRHRAHVTPKDCALLELPAAGTPIDLRLRAADPDGFLAAWSLSAVRGSNHSVVLIDGATSAPVGGVYADVAPFRFHSTSELPGADLDGFVTLHVTPARSDWLLGEDLCAFRFELAVTDRTTNGKAAPGSSRGVGRGHRDAARRRVTLPLRRAGRPTGAPLSRTYRALRACSAEAGRSPHFGFAPYPGGPSSRTLPETA